MISMEVFCEFDSLNELLCIGSYLCQLRLRFIGLAIDHKWNLLEHSRSCHKIYKLNTT